MLTIKHYTQPQTLNQGHTRHRPFDLYVEDWEDYWFNVVLLYRLDRRAFFYFFPELDNATFISHIHGQHHNSFVHWRGSTGTYGTHTHRLTHSLKREGILVYHGSDLFTCRTGSHSSELSKSFREQWEPQRTWRSSVNCSAQFYTVQTPSRKLLFQPNRRSQTHQKPLD